MISNRLEWITPQKAREYLGRNTNNRPIRRAVVEAYARDMAAGNWRVTHQGIAFSESGELVDGQHRLMAVIRAGVNVQMVVTRGVEDAAKVVIDQNAARSLADSLKLTGVQADNSLTAFIRFFADTKLKIARRGGKMTSSEAAEFCNEYPAVVRIYRAMIRAQARIPAPVAVALVCAVLNGESIDTARKFISTYVLNSIYSGYNCKAVIDFAAWAKAKFGAPLRTEMLYRGENAFYQYAYDKKRVSNATAERYKVTADQCKSFDCSHIDND